MTDTTQAIGTKLFGKDKENVSRYDGFPLKKTQFDALVGRYSDAQRFDTTSSERQNFDPLVGVKTAGLAAKASKFTKSSSNFFP